jgi:Kef-type K+ transport system membrane component KefB
MTTAQLSVAFFLQMFFILAVCRLVGWLGRKLGQPQVVGEMIAGVFMGPSLLGLIFPNFQQQIFPKETLKFLYIGAQLGVGLYMFLVGVEFKTELFRSRARSAASVSIAGMLAPFLCAVVAAPWLMKIPGLFSDQATQSEATLFLGAAIAITAFPMLARIIYERGLTGTPLGTLALAAGAIDDAAAWCVLAIVLASFHKMPDGSMNIGAAALAIGGGLTYGAVMIFAGRKLLAPLGRIAEREGNISSSVLAVVLMLFCLAAWAMDGIGIHAVFGGFLLGTAMPRGFFARELQQKLQPFVVVFLLPMFFTYSGLNTRLDMVNTAQLALVAVIVLVISIFGKGVACWGAARLNGEDNRTALAVGALMNSRGLMELIIINIGLQKGVIQPALFSIMVIMAVTTTLMASPVFEMVYGRHARTAEDLKAVSAEARIATLE